MFGDSYPNRSHLSEVQIHAIERITDFEFYLISNAAKGESFEVVPSRTADNTWTAVVIHTNPFGFTRTHTGHVTIEPFQKGLHNVGIEFRDLGHKVVVASKGEAYYGAEKTKSVLDQQFKDTYAVFFNQMPRSPFHIDMKADGAYYVYGQPERPQAPFQRSATAQTLNLRAVDKTAQARTRQPRKNTSWGIFTAFSRPKPSAHA